MSGSLEHLTTALADRYTIERELGRGGMATVYAARDVRHGRLVAIKLLHPELSAVLGSDRFLKEIELTAALQHPHILPLFDSGSADGQLYYVMPFVDGETLRTRLERETQLPVEDAVRIAREVADALHYAHQRGVIHRDIKPENILLQGGHALVADFGIALAVQQAGGQRMTQTGLSLGTPQYMSPEQAMGERTVDARSDIYALGAVTYEMLSGEAPFTGPSVQAIVARVLSEEPRGLAMQRKSVPPGVEQAVMRALQKLPADRFESAARFSEALTQPGSTTATTMTRGEPGDRSWFADRRSWLALGVAAASLAAAAFFAVRSRADASERTVVSVDQKSFERETIFTARWSPDGKTIIYSAARGGDLGSTLMVGRMAAANARLYAIRPEYPEPQPFGPDSAHLLAVSSTGELALLTHPRFINHRVFAGTLARMSFGGGAPREIAENVQEADWSPDGSQLAITRSTGAGDQLEYPVGRVLYRSRSGGYLSDPRVSPGGDRVALFDHPIRYDDRGSLITVDTAGNVVTVVPIFWGLEGLAWQADGRSMLFGGSAQGGVFQVHRVEIGGEPRLLLPSPGTLTLHDATRDGRWLVTRDASPRRIFMRAPGKAGVEDISWLDYALNPLMSADGKLIAFTDQSIAGGTEYSVMVGKSDGSPVVRVGKGSAIAISPDGRSVIAVLPTAPPEYRLYPIGAGEPRTLAWSGLEAVSSVAFFPDGRSLFVCGSEKSRAPRCYRSPLDAASLEPVTPDSVGGGLLRPDGLAVAIARGDGWWIHPLSGGAARLVPGLNSGIVARWSPDGSALWVQSLMGPKPHFEQVDVATGRRTPLVTIDMPVDIPVFAIINISLADDPRVYAYTASSHLSELFTVTGVR